MNMEIISKSVTIREFVEGYNNQDKEEKGVTTMNGKLNLRPSFQCSISDRMILSGNKTLLRVS